MGSTVSGAVIEEQGPVSRSASYGAARLGPFIPSPFAAPPKGGQKVQRWLIDSGCGHDLIGEDEASIYPMKDRSRMPFVGFSTANGKTTPFLTWDRALQHES